MTGPLCATGTLLALMGCAQVLSIEEAQVDGTFDPELEVPTQLVSSDESPTCQQFDNRLRLTKRGPNGGLRPLPAIQP